MQRRGEVPRPPGGREHQQTRLCMRMSSSEKEGLCSLMTIVEIGKIGDSFPGPQIKS